MKAICFILPVGIKRTDACVFFGREKNTGHQVTFYPVMQEEEIEESWKKNIFILNYPSIWAAESETW